MRGSSRTWGSRALALLFLLSSAASCNKPTPFVASAADYAAYREVRLTRGELQRLVAAWTYLREHPQGEFEPEVRPWFEREDQAFIEAGWRDPKRLRAYLDAMAGAPRAPLVEGRLLAIAQVNSANAQREQEFLEAARARQVLFEQAKRDRAVFVGTFQEWLGRVLSVTQFGMPIANMPAAFREAFQSEASGSTCEPQRCRKDFSFEFAVPEQKGLVSRQVTFALLLEREEAGVVRVGLSGPRLLKRLGEALAVRAAASGNAQAAAEALGAAVDFIDLTAAVRFEAPECEVDVVSPVVLGRRCGGVEFTVQMALTSGQPDTLWFAPAREVEHASDSPAEPQEGSPGDSGRPTTATPSSDAKPEGAGDELGR